MKKSTWLLLLSFTMICVSVFALHAATVKHAPAKKKPVTKAVFDCGTCGGPSHKCINNVCETGVRENVSSAYVSPGRYSCTYHYDFSDGSTSANYTQYNTAPCAL